MFSLAWNLVHQVLWISDNGFPDLGGTTEDVPCFIDEVSNIDFRMSYILLGLAFFCTGQWPQENTCSIVSNQGVYNDLCNQVNQPILTYPGAYRKVTVELKV